MIFFKAGKTLALVLVTTISTSHVRGALVSFAEDNCDGGCINSPNADAMHAQFLSNIQAPEVESFESFSVGSYSTLSVNSFSQAGTVELKGTKYDIRQGNIGFGRFPLHGTKFLDAQAGPEFRLEFQTPVAAFGFYGVDLGDFSGTISIKTSLGGGSVNVYPIPFNGQTSNGDVIFWGVTDASKFDKIEFDTSHSVDYFAFDMFTVASLQQITTRPPTATPTPVPTPSPTLAPTTPPTAASKSLPIPVLILARGDPHFRTWSGENFDFHGVCDLVLLSNPNFRDGTGMDIHIRTQRTRQWSYIESAVVRIGGDTLEVMGGHDGARFWVNKIKGEDNIALSLAGYPFKSRKLSPKAHQYVLDLGHSVEIEIKTWNAYVSVRVDVGNGEDFASSLGLMGTYPQSIKLARDNKTVFDDTNAFGQEWQVLANEEMLFHEINGPQAPEVCKILSPMDMRRRLGEGGISSEEAMITCSRVDKEDIDMCVFDVIATNDKDVAGAY